MRPTANAITRVAAAVALTAIVVTAGCANTDPIEGQWDDVRAYPRISLSQSSLEKALGFQEPIVTRTQNDLLHVTVPIRARSKEMLHIEYRVLFFDDKGRPIPPGSGWIPVRLEPRQPQYIVFNSTSTEAQDYNMQVRWSRP